MKAAHGRHHLRFNRNTARDGHRLDVRQDLLGLQYPHGYRR
ncbi:Unknown protein sequence [Pseudomonas syringae pv. maculicola]|nr:Unknown protein sequence [Pseudomonas syringae pv. maculicola]